MKNLILLVALLLISCSHVSEWAKETFEPKSVYDEVHENHQALSRQRLIPRPGNEGYLTNRVCLKFYGSKCEKVSMTKYDLNDEKVRHKLNEFRFACYVGGKRYRICKDRPGLCRTVKTDNCLNWKRTIFLRRYCAEYEIKKTYLDAVNDYQFLLDGATECTKGK